MAVRESTEQALARWKNLELLQDYYRDFDTLLVDVIEDLMKFKCSWLQQDIGEYLVNGPKYRMIQAQRGQAKTTITAIYAVWRLIHNPTTRVLIISAGDTQATEIANWIIQIINNMPELECMRPDRSNGDRASVEAFDVHYSLKGPEKSPSVACIGITSNMQGKRADILIADDIESSKNSQTQVQRDRIKHLTLDFSSICSIGDIIYLGTPQNIDSVYNGLPGRGFDVRIWPGRYPTDDELRGYDGRIAPAILKRLSAAPHLSRGGGPTGERGQPTDPVLLNEEVLTKKEIDQGAAYFQLQHMLSTALSDAERFPLKLGSVRFLRLTHKEDKVPMALEFVAVDQNRIIMPEGHPVKDRVYRVQKATDFGDRSRIHLYIDPSGGGQNGDETAWAASAFCAGRVILYGVGGFKGGLTDESLTMAANIIEKFDPFQVDVEKNFGNGAFAQVLRPRMTKWQGAIEDVWETGQKELRIIDTLEPVIGSGKLVINEQVIEDDWVDCAKHPAELRSTYSMLWQMSRITRDKNSLIHDDRLDAVAGTVRHWVELLSIDSEKEKAKARNEAYQKMISNPLGNGRPLPNWSSMHRATQGPNMLTKFGLQQVNHLRRT